VLSSDRIEDEEERGMRELWRASALELARLVRTREATAVAVVEAHLARIEAVNPRLNAVVHIVAGEALEAARAADIAVERGAPAPLLGVPFTVKENIDVSGQPTTWGVKALAQAIAPHDAPIVARLRSAGAILIGRTNMPDMGLRMTTDSSLRGLTRNPWSHDHTAGGSSGGEGSALASGMSALGLGNDLGGSVRNPAHACGIAALRPSAGRVPHAGFVPSEDQMLFAQMMMVHGPMARTVADLKLALRVIEGAHPRDPFAIDMPPKPLPPATAVRVALVAEPPGGDCDPAIVALVRRAADALSKAGYEVTEAVPPMYEEAIDVWAKIICAELRTVWDRLGPLMGATGAAMTEAFFASSEAPDSIAGFSKLFVKRGAIARAWSQFMAQYPLVLTPTATRFPVNHAFDSTWPNEMRRLSRPVLPANLLGLPSVSVPMGLDAKSGLPAGALITGTRFSDELCLEAAGAIESATGVLTPVDPAWK
jgi:amidase